MKHRFSRRDRLFVPRKSKIVDCKAGKSEPGGRVARAQAPGVRQMLKRFFFVPADKLLESAGSPLELELTGCSRLIMIVSVALHFGHSKARLL
jgi:hypothetical protein